MLVDRLDPFDPLLTFDPLEEFDPLDTFEPLELLDPEVERRVSYVPALREASPREASLLREAPLFTLVP